MTEPTETPAVETAGEHAIYGVPLTVQVVLGRAVLRLDELMKLGRGGVVELDRRVNDPVEIMVNGRVVARGEIMVFDETGQLAVTLSEIVRHPAE
ncbi:flagellar motor switch protein FliN [Inquilinus sp. NPDC058860]|uniref:flagellar motor switch protein FliN n=1 Tax=Inquilinus sp. NPDC058860 TaxID=3346652 RepID=UPI00368321CA